MLILAHKIIKLLVVALSLLLVFCSSVSAQDQILCIGSNGHTAIESVLDDCCEHEASQETTINADACGNCRDLSLVFHFYQSSHQEQIELVSLSSSPIIRLIEALEPNKPINNSHMFSSAPNYNLAIRKITVLLV